MSERILQCQLKLAHRDGRIADHPEALTRGSGRRSCKCRTRENVRLRPIPGRVVQHVERFDPELYDVVFVMRHMELFVHREIDLLEGHRRRRARTDGVCRTPKAPAHTESTCCLAETAYRSPVRGCRCCCRWTWRTCRSW